MCGDNLTYPDETHQPPPFFEQSPPTPEDHPRDIGDDGHTEDQLEREVPNLHNDWTELTVVG